MKSFLYVLFGFIDSFTILFLTFKAFRLPVTMYLRDFTIMATALSITSFVNRIVLEVNGSDVGAQFVLIVVFFRLLFKIRIYESALIAAIGYLSYLGIQFVIYPVLMSFGLVTLSDGKSLVEWGTFLIQLITDVTVLVIGWLIGMFNFGFSFIMQPPHDLYQKGKLDSLKIRIICGLVLGIITISTTTYWIFIFKGDVWVLILPILAPLLLLLRWLIRRDKIID
ncbi:hypothetical protein [Brevibacillus laterosporus]|uniref:hypothetical protein n=1 Tax=Brevibacillus laterosporus TaxID=1465 RepID=UPI002651D6FB|nr:hypothetical protein [Brevibacillus laterosporus]MDN9011490.1 hypothetical protein [Brevibacillus laterosporus]MDO0942877.1 hypothetical protein [Brevibacillus laterosporus]